MYSHFELLKPKEWLCGLHKVQVTQAKVTESTCVSAVTNVGISSPGTTFFKYQIIRNAGLKEFTVFVIGHFLSDLFKRTAGNLIQPVV